MLPALKFARCKSKSRAAVFSGNLKQYKISTVTSMQIHFSLSGMQSILSVSPLITVIYLETHLARDTLDGRPEGATSVQAASAIELELLLLQILLTLSASALQLRQMLCLRPRRQ